ncbi:MAG: hypothetical protein JNL13_07875 [Chitinophagaceae bacterium]|nr:hypothetical protein [Chitinophagaceae bacterium]
MRKFILLFFLLFTKDAFSQKLDEKLFNELCLEILRQENLFKQKEELLKDGVSLEEDIVNNTKQINYGSGTFDAVRKFRKKALQEQLLILSASSLPIFPLSDTLYIYDKQSTLSDNLVIIKDVVFKVITQLDKNYFNNVIILEQVKLRENEVVFVLSFNNDVLRVLFTCTLNKVQINSSKMLHLGDF